MATQAAWAVSPQSSADVRKVPCLLREQILARAGLMPVMRGQIIISQGASTDDVYLVVEGRVQVVIYSANGREVIMSELSEGCLFGEMAVLDERPRSASVIALTNGQMARVTGDDFLDIISKAPQSGLWLARQLSDRVRDLTKKSYDLVTLPVAVRIHDELLRLASEAGVEADNDQPAMVRLPTHAALAAKIGTHREAVSRELAQLEKEGVLTRNGRNVEICSVARLRNVGANIRQ